MAHPTSGPVPTYSFATRRSRGPKDPHDPGLFGGVVGSSQCVLPLVDPACTAATAYTSLNTLKILQSNLPNSLNQALSTLKHTKYDPKRPRHRNRPAPAGPIHDAAPRLPHHASQGRVVAGGEDPDDHRGGRQRREFPVHLHVRNRDPFSGVLRYLLKGT